MKLKFSCFIFYLSKIRQMKIVMDKRLGQAEIERRRLEQLVSSRSSSFHGSTVSLDSNSDNSGESPTPKPETSSDMPQPTGEKVF